MNGSLQDVHNTIRTQNSSRDVRRTCSVSRTTAQQPHARTLQDFRQCKAPQHFGVEKDIQRMLVDHNYQIEPGEIQQRSNNTTYTVLTTIRDQLIERIFQMTNVSSFTFSQELDVTAPHSHYHQRSVHRFARTNQDTIVRLFFQHHGTGEFRLKCSRSSHQSYQTKRPQTCHSNSLPLCQSVRQNQPAHPPNHTQLW